VQIGKVIADETAQQRQQIGISDCGRDQFSELKEKIVKTPMPRSPAARTVLRKASTRAVASTAASRARPPSVHCRP